MHTDRSTAVNELNKQELGLPKAHALQGLDVRLQSAKKESAARTRTSSAAAPAQVGWRASMPGEQGQQAWPSPPKTIACILP